MIKVTVDTDTFVESKTTGIKYAVKAGGTVYVDDDDLQYFTDGNNLLPGLLERVAMILKENGLDTIEDIVNFGDLTVIDGIGEKTAGQITEAVNAAAVT